MTKVFQAVADALAQLGLSHIFGVVGSGNFELTNALRANGIRFTAARHEGGATTMADAYARTTDTVAAVSLHQGCGLTNAMTGIAEAAKSRTPLLILTADAGTGSLLSNFRVDQDALAGAVGAVAERVHTPKTAVADAIRAYRTARDERRCVVLSLPVDIQTMDAYSEKTAPERISAPTPQPVRPAAGAVVELAELLDTARRPVFLCGRGARPYAGELRALAARTGALLSTSAVAHGLFHDEPWSLGICGGFAAPATLDLIADADLIIGWGCALNRWTMRNGALIGPQTRLAQVDHEAAGLGAQRRIDLGVLGDVGQTARDVLNVCASRTGYRTPAAATRIATDAHWREVPYEDTSTAEHIDPRTLSIALDDLLPAQRTVAIDSGNFMGYPSAYLSVPDEAGFCFTQGFQSIGLGLATGIGAALARPDRIAVAALGDGGALMAAAELETAARLGIALVVVVYDDHAYGAEVHHFGAADMSTVVFPDTDIAALARGAGFTAATVRRVEDLAVLSEWLAGPRDRPLLLDAKVVSGGSWWLHEAFEQH
ncbi:thiamine pyrophosphate-binding protein [Nocardia panacis]|uniref:acetolactate synthase n=1 Tax=Nocardia panacis TaxID=2340916 RepID=A0A3A4K356_9NOCA|nr:thiamine pyrophosphate-binding protein [Nocardia panacis]RJO70924.1 thiamine pyrophosphate-binding protein [Nocardia panacis]